MTTANSIPLQCANVQSDVPIEHHDVMLLDRIRRHDHAALAEFYDRYHLQLFSYLYRFTNSHSFAEDVLQEVMLVVWQKAGSYKGSGKVSTWVFGIAHHLAMTALRRDRTSAWLEWERAEEIESQDNSPEGDVVRQATAEAIVEALSKLSLLHRTVLELAFYQDFSGKEIAAILHIPEGTVKSRLNYANRALQGALVHRKEDLL